MTHLSLIIPAYNEANRIGKTLSAYADYFAAHKVSAEILVVLNGCRDNTLDVVQQYAQQHPTIRVVNLTQAGKGLAIIEGFKDALTRNATHIGFVDADMATKPEYFHVLIQNIGSSHGVIASRYMRGAQVTPARPFVKQWGRKLVYHSLIRALFGLKYKDFQCGAKLFKREVIEAVVPHLTVGQWAFDVELLYLGKKKGFTIQEIPTVWHDQAESKLKIMGSGMRMLSALFKMRWHHLSFR